MYFQKISQIQEASVGRNPGEHEWNDEMDARGLVCPEPVMMLHGRMADLKEGQVLRVIATDPSTTRDIPRFCQFLNHELLESDEKGGEFVYLIRRGI